MRWQAKCAIDNFKGLLPGQNLLRRAKRRLFGYQAATERVDFAIEEGIKLINFIRSSRDIAGAVCLEIGSGWEPAIPMLFSLCGAQKVIMTDLHRLCTRETALSALAALQRNWEVVVAGLGLKLRDWNWHLDPRRLNINEIFDRFRLQYLAPCDCTKLSIPDRSIDVVYSRSVLEHIPPNVIERIFLESKRVLAESGVACHFIDPSDHWEHSDKRISRINFLRYSDTIFRLTYLNCLNYHNRLRHSDYMQMLRRAGFNPALILLKRNRSSILML